MFGGNGPVFEELVVSQINRLSFVRTWILIGAVYNAFKINHGKLHGVLWIEQIMALKQYENNKWSTQKKKYFQCERLVFLENCGWSALIHGEIWPKKVSKHIWNTSICTKPSFCFQIAKYIASVLRRIFYWSGKLHCLKGFFFSWWSFINTQSVVWETIQEGFLFGQTLNPPLYLHYYVKSPVSVWLILCRTHPA